MTLLETLGLISMAFVAVFTYRAYTQDAGPGQSPRSAIIEAWINICIGFTVNFAANLVLIPLMTDGGHMSASANFWGGWIYTSISVVRQYSIRRFFNAKLHALAVRLAGDAA